MLSCIIYGIYSTIIVVNNIYKNVEVSNNFEIISYIISNQNCSMISCNFAAYNLHSYRSLSSVIDFYSSDNMGF